MELSFELFTNPRKIVKNALETPNIGLALLIVALPMFLVALGQIWYGLDLNLMNIITAIIISILTIVIISLTWFLIGKPLGNEYGLNGVISSISLTWIFIIIMTILGLLSPLAFSNETRIISTISAENNLTVIEGLEIYQAVESGNLTKLNSLTLKYNLSEENQLSLEAIARQGNISLINPIIFGLFILLGIITIIYGFIILPYLTISEIYQKGFLINLVLYLVLGFISITIPGIISIPLTLI